jgi:hypothetical protein
VPARHCCGVSALGFAVYGVGWGVLRRGTVHLDVPEWQGLVDGACVFCLQNLHIFPLRKLWREACIILFTYIFVGCTGVYDVGNLVALSRAVADEPGCTLHILTY